MLSTILIIIAVGVGAAILYAVYEARREAELQREIDKLEGFSASSLLTSSNKILAFDQQSRQLALAIRVGGAPEVLVFPVDAITGVEIERDEGSSRTRRTGFVSFTTTSSLRSLVLAITLRDPEVPVIRIRLFTFDNDCNETLNTARQERAVETANRWKSMLSSFMRIRVDQDEPAKLDDSLSHQLQALHRLHVDGGLTQEEFAQAKARLLTVTNHDETTTSDA